MKKLIKKTACVQDPLNDFKKKAGITDDNKALFVAVLIADSFLEQEKLRDIVETFKNEVFKENVKVTRR